jgi:Helix-turn-helix domain
MVEEPQEEVTTMSAKSLDPNAFAFSIPDAARFSALGPTTIKALIRTGRLSVHKHGKRSLVLRGDLETHLKGLPKGALPAASRGDAGRFVSPVAVSS